jgi:LysM repeat protein
MAASAGAQSLRGSQASVQKMYTRAVLNDLDFYKTSKGIYQSVRDGELVMISITMDLTLEKVGYPFVLPRTRDVLNVFAKKYREACGERLVVTSAARPRTEQPRNASPHSVHPTGMAIDFRRPSGACLEYMRKELVQLERQGVLEATEERRPVHFHVAVLQRGRFAPAAPAIATATTAAPATPTQAPTTIAPAPVTVDSAPGTVEPPEPKPAPAAAKTYTVRKGDNLSTIAKRFGLSVSRLKALNGMKGSVIQPGKKLRVS